MPAKTAGRFEAADGGTIFLDEIGNVPLALQAKLLTVLQNRTVTRVGSNRPRNIDVRVIAATNQDLYDMVRNRHFRQDLLYRINTIEISLPPLRERPEDIEPLATHFLQQFAQKYHRPVRGFSAELLREMSHYRWPGNIRELQHAVERAVIMAKGEKLESADFFPRSGPQQQHAGRRFFYHELRRNGKTADYQGIAKTPRQYHGSGFGIGTDPRQFVQKVGKVQSCLLTQQPSFRMR